MHDPCMQGNTWCSKLIQLIINCPITYYRCAKLYQLDAGMTVIRNLQLVSCISTNLMYSFKDHMMA